MRPFDSPLILASGEPKGSLMASQPAPPHSWPRRAVARPHARRTSKRATAPSSSPSISGLPRDSLSPGLRRELETLSGEPLNRQRLIEIAARIEGEQPDVVAAVRSVARPDDQARVIFLVARISDDGSLVRTSTRATPWRASRSAAFRKPTSAGRCAIAAGAGRPAARSRRSRRADRQLEAERPGFAVERRIERGTERGRIRVVFEFSEKEGTRWIPFTPTRSKFVYHSDQGWSGALDIPMGGRNHRVTAGFAFDNNDDLVEEYSGVRLRLRAGSSRPTGSARDRGRLVQQHLARPTLFALAADPEHPEPYRSRLTVEPSVTFALNPSCA